MKLVQPIIREAHTGDLKTVSRLLVAIAELHHHALPLLHAPPDLAATEQFLSDEMKNEDAHALLAELEGQVVGFVRFQVQSHHPPMVVRSYVHVGSLVVQESHRHQGLGQALMEQVHLWAQDHGIEDVLLNVYEFNAQAIKFYEKLGYETVSRRMRRRPQELGQPE